MHLAAGIFGYEFDGLAGPEDCSVHRCFADPGVKIYQTAWENAKYAQSFAKGRSYRSTIYMLSYRIPGSSEKDDVRINNASLCDSLRSWRFIKFTTGETANMRRFGAQVFNQSIDPPIAKNSMDYQTHVRGLFVQNI